MDQLNSILQNEASKALKLVLSPLCFEAGFSKSQCYRQQPY